MVYFVQQIEWHHEYSKVRKQCAIVVKFFISIMQLECGDATEPIKMLVMCANVPVCVVALALFLSHEILLNLQNYTTMRNCSK